VKLTKVQIDALEKLNNLNEYECSYNLRCGLNTLYALYDRGLVKIKDLASFRHRYTARTSILWKITNKGRNTLNNIKSNQTKEIN